MTVTASGENLSVLLVCNHAANHDWMSFAASYSVLQNLPQAEVSILCSRDLRNGYASFAWPYRTSNVRFFQYKNLEKHCDLNNLNKIYAIEIALKQRFVRQPLLVADCNVMAVRPLSHETLESLNASGSTFAHESPIWYFNQQPIERFASILNNVRSLIGKNEPDFINETLCSLMGRKPIADLCCKCTDSELATFVQYDRCGRFNKEHWMNERQDAPFHFTGRLQRGVSSDNERRVLEMWQQMCCVYDALR